MASADFCMGFPAPLDVGSTEVPLGTLADLPGYDAPTFTLMPVGYTSRRSVQVSGFADICLLTPPCRLISASCSSGQRFAFSFLQISSRPEHPCRSANSSPCRASRGLPPPSECALPGAPTKSPCRSHRRGSRARRLFLNRSDSLGATVVTQRKLVDLAQIKVLPNGFARIVVKHYLDVVHASCSIGEGKQFGFAVV